MSRSDEGTLQDHLEELRRRILVSAIAVVAAAAACFFLSDWLLKLLLLPSGGLELRAFGILDGFMIRLRLALYAGVVVSFPVWAWQAARFVGPALVSGEKRRMVPFLAAALLLFGAGTVFGYQLLGITVQVLVRLFPPQIEYVPSATDYLSFSAFFLLACGTAFELPCVLVLLVSLKVIRAESLRRKRKVAWFILFAFAQVVTPVADPIVAPLTVMVPLVLLYEGSVLVARLIEARRGRASPPETAS